VKRQERAIVLWFTKNISGFIALCVFLLFSGCVPPVDPQQDYEGATAELSKNSIGKLTDSLLIFQTDTLVFELHIGALIDSIVVLTPANRHGERFTCTPDSMTMCSVVVSYLLQGQKNVSWTVYKKNGDTQFSQFPFTVVNPLEQIDFVAEIGKSSRLHAGAVSDTSAVYQWEFTSSNRVVRSKNPELRISFSDFTTVHNGQGFFSVVDPLRAQGTQRQSFTYSLVDTSGPSIQLLSFSSDEPGDTVFFSDTAAWIYVQVHDPSQVQLVTLDTIVMQRVEGTHFQAQIKGADQWDERIKPFTIQAWDSKNNLTRKTIWVGYDAIAPPQSTTQLYISSVDTVFAATRRYKIGGMLLWPDEDTTFVEAVVSHAATVAVDTVYKTSSPGVWELDVPLENKPLQELEIMAIAPNGKSLASQHMVIVYSPTLVDTAEPKMYHLSINGESISENQATLYTSATELHVRFYLPVLSEFIDYVSVNGQSAQAQSPGSGWYESTVAIAQGIEQQSVAVSAQLKSGYTIEKKIVVVRNSRPYISQVVPAERVVTADSLTRYFFEFADNEPDQLLVELLATPHAHIEQLSDNLLTLVVQPQDTGAFSLTLRASDTKQDTLVSVHFYAQKVFIAPLKVTASPEIFVVQPGIDTILPVTISVDGGMAPYEVVVEKRESAQRVFLTQLAHNGEVLFPYAFHSAIDSVVRYLQIIATDQRGVSDTVQPMPRIRIDTSFDSSFAQLEFELLSDNRIIGDSMIDMRTGTATIALFLRDYTYSPLRRYSLEYEVSQNTITEHFGQRDSIYLSITSTANQLPREHFKATLYLNGHAIDSVFYPLLFADN